MFIFTIAERSAGPLQGKMVLVSVLIVVFVAIVMFVRFILSWRYAREKQTRLVSCFYSYYELVRKSTGNLDTLVLLSTMSLSFPIYHPKIQTLLAKEQNCIIQMLAILDTIPEEFARERGVNISERRESLLKILETVESLIMSNKN